MYATVDNFDKGINLYTEDNDLCYFCTHVERCPLLAAICREAVVLRYASIGVESCGMYKEFCCDEMIAF